MGGEGQDMIEDVRLRVRSLLTEMLGSVEIDESGDFVLRKDSTRGLVSILDWGDGDALVKVEALLALHVPESPALFEWLAKNASDFHFGKPEFVANMSDPHDNTLLFSHVLYGNTIDQEELAAAIFSVMDAANYLDDEIVQRFGGIRAVD